jgi:MFS transporter, ACS family, hexuronate transporter
MSPDGAPRTDAVSTEPTRDSSGGAPANVLRPRGGAEPVSPSAPPPRWLGYRWTICALLFAATTINYVDRQVLGILAPTLQGELGWSESQYGDIVSWFSFAYAFGFLGAGRLLDRIGVRRGFAIAIVAWSVAAIGHAFARTAAGFSLARALLGLGESANFPGAIKTVAEWFPKRERALATGIFNAGTNVGAIITPLLVPWIALTWGWPWAFIVTGSLGFLWLVFWLAMYRVPEQHPRVSRAELALIRSDPPDPETSVSWVSLLRYRQTWAFATAKLLADPIWWFYLYWLPKFLDANYGIKLAQVAAPLIAVYLVADVGSVGGGWLSSALIKRGWTVNRARKTAMLAMALMIVPTMLAPHAGSMWMAVAIVSVAAAAHQGWSANAFTLASDMFPRRMVASVVGIGGFAGAVGGAAFQRITGRVLEATNNNYVPIFIVCGLAYVTAWLIIHLLAPRLQPVRIEEGVPAATKS